MIRILAIADDFSGAAEIAGVGMRHGLPTRLLRGRLTGIAEGLTVIDTDSRLMSPESASRAVVDAVASADLRPTDLVYKKTDSVFRGPIRAEIEALMKLLGSRAALLAPQNPSRGRTIRDRAYRINDIPLHETSFANDPDHPARTCDVIELLGLSGEQRVAYAEPDDLDAPDGIVICGACDLSAMSTWASRASREILPAGSSDFFASILASRGLAPTRPFVQQLDGHRLLFICGSASAYSRQLAAQAMRRHIPIVPMPDDVFGGGEISAWASEISRALESASRALVIITQPLDRAASTSLRLQTALADVASDVLSRFTVDHLLLEGGATASAVCRRMNWHAFLVLGELATGVVQLKLDSPSVPSLLIKPGSYPWPESVWQP